MQVFVQLMNIFALELGLSSSTIVNAHGMRNNKSNAHDIAVLTA
jgi:D-alanyl-D-alanine carboxypeptidase